MFIPETKKFLPVFLHLIALTAFAVAPLYDLLGKEAGFFTANLVPPVTIILAVVVLSFLLPALMAVIVGACGVIDRKLPTKVQTGIYGLFLYLLATLVAAGPISHISGISPVFYFLLLMLTAGLFVTAYFRLQSLQSFMTVLAPAALVFPLLFLFFSGVTPIIFPEHNQQIVAPAPKAGKSYPPVVMIVLDEITLSSLLDHQGEIDAVRYPGFAELASQSSWFKGASTLADNTLDALPMIITGRYPKGTDRTVLEKNDNIFTLLSATHRMVVTEKVTQLCPPEFCKKQINIAKSLLKLGQDARVVYLYLILPESLRKDLPDITQNWGDFGDGDQGEGKAKPNKPAETTAANPKDEGHNHRIRLFERFISRIKPIKANEKPPFYFMHILMPHVPFIFLPSGKYYGTGRSIGPHFPYPLSHDDRLLTEHYQRHLLQLIAVDRQLQKLLEKLKKTGVYEKSVIIVLADHGLNFRGGEPRRSITPGNYDEMLPVPLLIKRPYQTQGEIIEKPVRTMDLYSTLADLMAFPLPENGHGKSLFAKDYPDFKKLRIEADKHSDKSDIYPIVTQRQILAQTVLKSNWFGEGDEQKLFEIGPCKNWIGKPLNTLGLTVQPAASDFSWFLFDSADYQNVDLSAPYIPAMITGELYAPASHMPKELWVVVNGVLWSTYPVLEKSGNKMTFYALLPEKAFRQGQNKVQVLIPEGTSNRPEKLLEVQSKS